MNKKYFAIFGILLLVALVGLDPFLGYIARKDIKTSTDDAVAYAKHSSRSLNKALPGITTWKVAIDQETRFIFENLPKLKARTIHVIGNYHDNPFGAMSQEEIKRVRNNQQQMLKKLTELQPQLLGIEGCSTEPDSFNSDALASELQQLNTDLDHKPIDPVSDELGIHRKQHLELDYALNHSEIKRFGFEPPNAYRLCIIMGVLTSTYPQSEFHVAFRKLWVFRSYYAAAKLAYYMDKYNMNSGVVVIGEGHIYDFDILTTGYGAKVITHPVEQN